MRDFSSGLPKGVLTSIQEAHLRYTYRGVTFRKNPLDIAIYLLLLFRLQPRTVIEIGTLEGGSALWFADTLTTYGVEAHVYSVDSDSRPRISDPRITFLEGDARELSRALPEGLLRTLPRPFLVVEDSAHQYETTLAVLRFFDLYLKSGEYIVIEDGIVRDLPGERYRLYADGPNRAVTSFLAGRGDAYVIDEAYCDFFGYNFTANPNGYLRRV